MNKKKLFSLFSILALVLVILTGCGNSNSTSSKSSKDNKISIVTSTNIYADIANNIVGKYGNAQAIVTGDVDPHDFEPKTSDAKNIQNADIIVANGLGYDSWLDKLADASGKKVIKVGNDIMKLKSNANPHIWYDLNMPVQYTNYLVEQLSKLDKKHASYYKENGKKYIAKIHKVQTIANKINGKNSKPVFVSEPVFDYALSATGFKIGDKDFEDAIEKGTDPTPQVINKMNKDIAGKKIAFFVNNTQVESSTVSSFIKKAQAKNIPILSVRETMPNGTTYLKWITQNYENLAKVAKK
ncbi:zinc ABC transporter substrate-binding protein [Lactobacillus sp.]|uniref:metal ABC transporter solute-binding protein, Zn/Mn family n=1 Tax=Lactobacillus sp. TaxID=1591 RepID=UPI001997ABA4|nr:zinc ABC transporter substrate-binding protein [Lactobacillus sp.]MBD5429105.1 zinc ABC transporter solute-binding protein [Lactobacillus sp.]MBD5430603.1 zinc ABC transporter solute-binding protein [Lactobacillus sp.]